MDATTILAIYATVVSTIVLLVQIASFARDSDDLALRIGTCIVIGSVAVRLGSDHIVQVSVTSRGGRPVGVSSLALQLNDRKKIPLLELMPEEGNRRLPAVLARGEHSTYYLAHDPLRDELRVSGRRITHVVANLADGTKRSQKVPADWHRLGE